MLVHLLSMCMLLQSPPKTVQHRSAADIARSVAIVIDLGSGAKCNGQALDKGQLIFPGQRVTTGQGWVSLVTRKWGPTALGPKRSWPPLNQPRKASFSDRAFGAVVDLFDRKQRIKNAGSKAGDDPKEFALIKIATEGLGKGQTGVRVAYAVREDISETPELQYEDGETAPLQHIQRLAKVDRHTIFTAVAKARVGRQPSIEVAHLTLSSEAGRMDEGSFYLAAPEVEAQDAATLRMLTLSDQSGSSDESLMLGDIWAAFGPSGTRSKNRPYFPVRAIEAYIKAMSVARYQDEARLGLQTLLDSLDCSLAQCFGNPTACEIP